MGHRSRIVKGKRPSTKRAGRTPKPASPALPPDPDAKYRFFGMEGQPMPCLTGGLSLAAAAAAYGRSPERLRRSWEAMWGERSREPATRAPIEARFLLDKTGKLLPTLPGARYSLSLAEAVEMSGQTTETLLMQWRAVFGHLGDPKPGKPRPAGQGWFKLGEGGKTATPCDRSERGAVPLEAAAAVTGWGEEELYRDWKRSPFGQQRPIAEPHEHRLILACRRALGMAPAVWDRFSNAVFALACVAQGNEAARNASPSDAPDAPPRSRRAIVEVPMWFKRSHNQTTGVRAATATDPEKFDIHRAMEISRESERDLRWLWNDTIGVLLDVEQPTLPGAVTEQLEKAITEPVYEWARTASSELTAGGVGHV